MRRWTFLVVLSVALAASKSEKDVWWDVKIAQGPVRGRLDTEWGLYSFHNIPYATAPTDGDKFKAPLPPPTWVEPYDAVDQEIICPQFVVKPLMPENIMKTENCLVANIYVPDTKEDNLSVLVNVHGGGFQLGFGDWLKAKNLMQYKDLIVVTFNYRLGAHGFLCLGTEDIPGNAGMKDQVALLRWVQKNIAAFGGNPNDVTISGYSAGAASVDLLMISRAAEGLFHRVIPESGTGLAALQVQFDPLQNAKDYARKLNFTNVDNIIALEEFYKSVPYDILAGDGFEADPAFIFSPCVEPDTNDGAFLTEPPVNILKRGDYKKIPMLFGFANMEGLLRVGFFDETWTDNINENFSDLLPVNLKFESDDEKERVAKDIKEFYIGDKPIVEDDILKLIDYFSDVYFVHATLWAVKLHCEAGHDQIYLYEYSFVDNDTPLVPHTNVRGATHCAQTMALFDGKGLTDSSEDDISQELKNMKKILREIWHNFIKTGKPISDESSLPAWPAVNATRSPHMSLGQKVELRGALAEDRAHFWETVYRKYYQPPMLPLPSSSKSRAEL